MKGQVLGGPTGWRHERTQHSLPESFASVPTVSSPWWRRALAFVGPGYMVAVGYMDPGNWATDLAGGSQFGYALLSVILLSNLMAILLQALSAKLGIVSGRDLAQACRDAFPRPVSWVLWLMCELAIAAMDLAEVLGSAIALKLLFGIPLLLGVGLTVLDVFLILVLQRFGIRWLEAVVITLMTTIGLCFAAQLAWAHPPLGAVLAGFLPSSQVVLNKEMLYIAIGILGATVMPHNLYLHSAIVQTRAIEPTDEGRRTALRYATIDSTVALMAALAINAAILIIAAATFHRPGMPVVAEIEQAYQMLSPTLGAPLASTLFAVALLASGQNATLTGTLAGQIVMEGFLDLRLPPWLRRLLTRAVAIVPAVVVIALFGEGATGPLLIASQVVLSLQLPFAVFPLVAFTSDRLKMGAFVNALPTKLLAYGVALLISGLNVWLIAQTVMGWLGAKG